MNSYRCYFFRKNHIVAVEIIASEGDEAATAVAEAMLGDKPDYEGIELWEGDRKVQMSADVSKSA